MSLLVPIRRNTRIAWPTFGELEQQLDRMLSNNTENPDQSPVGWSPAIDIRETEDAYILEADLPGMRKEDIDLKVVEDRVTLTGSRKRSEEHKENGYRRYERTEGRFERSFRLRGGIDGNKVEAHFEHGVLTVTLPKPEATKPRQIEVKVN
jgi:HSP20 family protein